MENFRQMIQATATHHGGESSRLPGDVALSIAMAADKLHAALCRLDVDNRRGLAEGFPELFEVAEAFGVTEELNAELMPAGVDNARVAVIRALMEKMTLGMDRYSAAAEVLNPAENLELTSRTKWGAGS